MGASGQTSLATSKAQGPDSQFWSCWRRRPASPPGFLDPAGSSYFSAWASGRLTWSTGPVSALLHGRRASQSRLGPFKGSGTFEEDAACLVSCEAPPHLNPPQASCLHLSPLLVATVTYPIFFWTFLECFLTGLVGGDGDEGPAAFLKHGR